MGKAVAKAGPGEENVLCIKYKETYYICRDQSACMMKMTGFLVLVFCFLWLGVRSQGSAAQEGKALLERSKQLQKEKKFAEAMAAARSALSLLRNSNDPALAGQAYYNMSEQYTGNFADTTIHIRYAYLDSAIGPLNKAGDTELLANCYRLMADLDHLVNKIDKALQEANISLKYYQAIHYARMQDIYSLFARLYYLSGDYRQSLEYGFKALTSANATKDSGMRVCEIENTLGFTYFKLEDIENALKHFELSIAVSKREKDSLTVRMLASNIVECDLKLGRPEEAKRFFTAITNDYRVAEDKYEMGSYPSDKAWFKIYMDMKDYKQAGIYNQKMLALTTGRKLNKLILSNCYENAIRFFTQTRQFGPAEEYLVKNEKLIDSLHDQVAMTRNYDQWFILDTMRGDFRSAAIHSNKLNKIRQEVFTAEKNNALARLQVEFESQKKENELREQRENVRQANSMRNISIIGVAILAIAGALIYRQFRQKRAALAAEERSNDQLRHLLTEKEWLLKEIHHRVKNNLQIVVSLLNSQSAHTDNEFALTAIRESQHRVYAMSLIHQKLYGPENVSSIDMARYISELTSYLADSFDTWKRIHFTLEIEPLQLDVSQAVPLGLVLNEVITNSIKYAFPDGRSGVIGVSLSGVTGQRYLLSISDNGIGIPPQFQRSKTGGLGMNLIVALTDNLEGDISIESNNGTTVKITFVHDQVVKRSRALLYSN